MDQVHFTTAHQDSPHKAVSADVSAEGVRLNYPGSEPGMFLISGRAMDMRAGESVFTALRIRFRMEQAPSAPVKLGVMCSEPLCGTRAGAAVDLAAMLLRESVGEWHELSIPLACFKDANLNAVEAPFALASSGGLKLTLAEVRLEAPAKPGACPAQ
jgi:beta-glucosidase